MVLSYWSEMLEADIAPNAKSYKIIITNLSTEGNFEMALKILTEMEKRDLSPSTETVKIGSIASVVTRTE